MSITDELRRFANGSDWIGCTASVTARKMLDVADRIDAEHEKRIASVMNDALYHANEKDMADLGWYRVLDADKQPIHLGDVMENIYGSVDVVEGILSDRYLVLRDNDWLTIRADLSHHHHEPTVEDMLREFALEIDPSADIAVTGAETIKKFATKLQLKEPDE